MLLFFSICNRLLHVLPLRFSIPFAELYSNLKNTVYGDGWQSSYSVSVPRSGSTALVVASGRNDPGMYLIYGVGQTANVMPIFEPAKTGELITYSISGQQVTFSSPENRGYNYCVVIKKKKL